MFEDAFVDDVLDAQDDVEGDAVFAELFVTHGWLEAGDAVLAVREDVARGLEGDALDLLEVAAVGDGQRDGDRALGQRLLVVHQGGGGDALVRHDDHIAGRGPERRVAPAHVGDSARGTGRELDVVADANLFRDECGDTGEEVRQGVLQGEGRCETADAEGCEQRRDGDAVRVEDQDDADGVDADVDHGGQDGGGAAAQVAVAELVLQEGRDEVRDEQSDREGQHVVEDHLHVRLDDVRQVHDVVGHGDAAAHAHHGRHEARDVVEDVLRQLCVAVDEIRDDAEDVVEQNDADDLADDEDGEVDMRPAVLDFVGQTVEGS